MKCRTWSSDDTAQLRRLVAAGMTDGEIGVRMGRDASVIRYRRQVNSIEPGMSRAAKVVIARLNLRRMRPRGEP